MAAADLVSLRAVKLICVDADGTLIGTGGAISERVWPAAAAAARAGIQVALCSGRPAFGHTRLIASQLASDGWHVFQNGASIVRVSTGESRSTSFLRETVEDLKSRARRTGRILELYGDSSYAVESAGERAQRHAAVLGVPFTPRSLDSFEGPVVRALWIVPLEETDTILNEPHQGFELAPSTTPMMPDTSFVNLTPPGVDKASGVRVLAEAYGCSLGEVMFVGDGLNDLPAMRIVGCPVAMGNAHSDLRSFSRFRVGDVDHGGLADAFSLAVNARA